MPILAYKVQCNQDPLYVSDDLYNVSLIVFATTEQQAIELANKEFLFDGCELSELQAERYAAADSYVTDTPQVCSDDHVYYDLMFVNKDEGCCSCCGYGVYESIKESYLNDDGECTLCAGADDDQE